MILRKLYIHYPVKRQRNELAYYVHNDVFDILFAFSEGVFRIHSNVYDGSFLWK